MRVRHDTSLIIERHKCPDAGLFALDNGKDTEIT